MSKPKLILGGLAVVFVIAIHVAENPREITVMAKAETPASIYDSYVVTVKRWRDYHRGGRYKRYSDLFGVELSHRGGIPVAAYEVEPTIMPITNVVAVVDFLAQRGLELSEQETTITHIETGFNFLGQNVRKRNNNLVVRPAKEGLKALVQKIRESIKGCLGQTAQTLIAKLNPIVRGWANYHRYHWRSLGSGWKVWEPEFVDRGFNLVCSFGDCFEYVGICSRKAI